MRSKSPLRSFLASRGEANQVSFEELRGFVFAVAGAPELVPPSEWLPEAFNGETPEFENGEQAQAILEELMGLYNATTAGGRRMRSQAPAFRKDTVSNLEQGAEVGRWSRGFIRGYTWLEDVWDEYTPKELDEELASILFVLSFFASRRTAEAFRDETAGGKSLEEIAELMRRTFRDAMDQFVQLGQTIYQAHLRHDQSSAGRATKVGRNEPCPCGSGAKYKRCCGTPAG